MEIGTIVIDATLCSGCRLCSLACSFEKTKEFSPRSVGMWVESDEVTGKANPSRLAKCDLCNGDPPCVKICPTGAIKFATILMGDDIDE